jgi:protein SCO1/2
MRIKNRLTVPATVLAVGLFSLCAAAQTPDRAGPLPPELEGMQVSEHLDAQLPRDLGFTDHKGKTVKLGDYFDGERPVILMLNYYRCPMLCGLTLNAVVDGLKQIDWTAGNEFRMLTVSFEPGETSDVANLKRQTYLNHYGRPQSADGWDFLVGQPEPINKLLDVTGYPVRWNETYKEWIHPACIMVLTPDGRLSRYLYGVYYNPQTLRLSLVEASEGKIGTTIDRVLLWCFQYDPEAGSYTLAAFWLVRTSGMITLVALGIFLVFQKLREVRRKAALVPAAQAESS